MLNLDQTRAYCFSDELITLVEAVVAADPADESRSIEWKETLDLTNAKNFTHLPQTILGFANRDPAEASREFRGYAYLVVGAEPGNVAGMTPMDPSDLVAKVQSYVGDVIIWHPDYVTVRGKSVLVIAVEPPQPGDPIHPLHKTFNNFAPGTIFTREPGRSVIAGVERQAMLQRRLRASASHLDLTVSADPDSIETAPDAKSAVDRWYDREYERLRLQESSDGQDGAEMDVEPGRGLFINSALFTSDRRSQDDYEQEVARYLKAGRRALAAEARKRIHQHAPSMLKLRVTNTTGRHFRRIQLVATVKGATTLDDRAFSKVRDQAAAMPTSPAPWGQEGWIRGINVSSMSLYTVTPAYAEPAFTVATSPERTEIEFRQFDLRTGRTWISPSIPLMTELSPRSHLEILWHTTADDADGWLEGTIVVDVTPSTLDLATLGDE